MAVIRPTFRIVANSADVTAVIAERLISLTVTDAVGIESDLLEITLADNDAAAPIEIPSTGAELELWLGYDGADTKMGLFIFDEVELAGWPSEMVLRARAAVYDRSTGGKSNLQTQKTRSWEVGTTLGDLVKTIAKEHGMTPAVAASLAVIPLPHIDQADESDINLLLRIGKKYDAVVKPAAGVLVLARRGESKSVSGQSLKPVTIFAKDCSNFRFVRAKRETAGMVVAYWHAVRQAKRNQVKVGAGEPVRRLRQYYPSEAMALAAARAEMTRRQRGEDTVALTTRGNPSITAEAPLWLEEFRPGVAGEWIITRVTHRIDASGGYVCDIEAEKPNPTAHAAVSLESD